MTNNELGLFIQPAEQRVVVSSRDVARVFGKEHAKVLRDIRNLECSEAFSQANFGLGFYKDAQNQERPEYLFVNGARLTREDFYICFCKWCAVHGCPASSRCSTIRAVNRLGRFRSGKSGAERYWEGIRCA